MGSDKIIRCMDSQFYKVTNFGISHLFSTEAFISSFADYHINYF